MTEANQKVEEAARMLFDDMNSTFAFTDERLIRLVVMGIVNLIKTIQENPDAREEEL